LTRTEATTQISLLYGKTDKPVWVQYWTVTREHLVSNHR